MFFIVLVHDFLTFDETHLSDTGMHDSNKQLEPSLSYMDMSYIVLIPGLFCLFTVNLIPTAGIP